MNNNELIFRPEVPQQYREMEELVRDAFWDKYSPGCSEHLVVHNFRNYERAVPELCLAAERDGKLVGGIWYALAEIRQGGQSVPVLTMGPVAVRPELQGQGFGSALIRHTLELAKGRAAAVIIYGNLHYYKRFGFRAASDFGITDSEGQECPAILVYPLGDNVPAGAFDEGPVYAVKPEDVHVFDRAFPHRQKHLNSQQLFFAAPTPPPEDKLLRQSWELRQNAALFLRSSGLLEILEGLGAKIRCVGSFRSNLMLNDHDIDLHFYTQTLDAAQVLQALQPIIASPRTQRFTYINGANTDEFCLEWHLVMTDEQNQDWTLDLIQILANSRLDGYFEDTTEAIIDALTPETQRTILELKAAAPPELNICGIEFYKAVLADHVKSWDEFCAWRQNHPLPNIVLWRPDKP